MSKIDEALELPEGGTHHRGRSRAESRPRLLGLICGPRLKTPTKCHHTEKIGGTTLRLYSVTYYLHFYYIFYTKNIQEGQSKRLGYNILWFVNIIAYFSGWVFSQWRHNFPILGEARYVTGDLVLLQVTWKVINHFGDSAFCTIWGGVVCRAVGVAGFRLRVLQKSITRPKASHSHQPPPHRRNSQQEQLTGNINVNVSRSRTRMSARMWARMWTRTRRRQRRLTGGRKEPPIKCDEEKAAGVKVENAGGRRGRGGATAGAGVGQSVSQSVSEMKVLCD